MAALAFGKLPPGMRLADAVMLATSYALFTYVAVGLITVPLLAVCVWRRWTTLWHAVCVGALTGALPFLTLAGAQLLDDRLHLHFRLHKLALAATNEFVFLGAISGAVFWVAAVWRNPKLSTRRETTSTSGASAA